METTLRDELAQLEAEHADVEAMVFWEPETELPIAMEPLAQNVVAEAVRNARKHAQPTWIDVASSTTPAPSRS